MTKKMIHIAVLMMVKNETKRLRVSLDSIKNFANSLVIFDTGSTDDTIDICKQFCSEFNIPLRLLEGEFENFATSRNKGLDFADTFEDIDYVLMMDTNDELRNGDKLRQYAFENLDSIKSSFLIAQEWWSGALNKYYNTRFIKPRDGWRYKGVVHEYLHNDTNIKDNKLGRLPDDVVLYQDRTQDDDKTGKRFVRDEVLLKAEYVKDPTEPRTVFYLAQTYSCLGDIENAYYYYKIRTTLVGFYEERFQASLKCGEFSLKLGLDWYDSFAWFMKAFDIIERVEPLLQIGGYYQKNKKWALAYMYFDLACKLRYPENCILFIDRLAYDYSRWHLISIVAYYAEYINEGFEACKIAIEYGGKHGLNIEQDKKNLELYKQKMSALPPSLAQPQSSRQMHISRPTTTQQPSTNTSTNSTAITKNRFIAMRIAELRKEKPSSTTKQLEQQAKMEWKKRSVSQSVDSR